MSNQLPRLVLRHARVLIATTIAVGIAASTMLAQFGTFQPSFNGELWGTRHEIHLANDGAPSGVAFVNGTLFIADSANQTLIAYDSNGDAVAIPGADWDANAALSPIAGFIPYQLASATVNKDGQDVAAILVSDKASNRLAAFEATGDYLFTVRLTRPAFPPAGLLPLQLSINQMALAPGAKFTFTTGLIPTLSTTGTFAAGWNEQWQTGHIKSGALVYPASSSYVPLLGEFHVDAANVLTGTESDPVAPTPLNTFGVTFDKVGHLYVLDGFTERLNVYSPAMDHLFTFGTPVPDTTTAEFHEPWGLQFWPDATGTGGRLFVADTYKNQILVYRAVDGSDTDLVIDDLQLETTVKNFTLDLDNLDKFSLALDSTQNLIATADHASTVLMLSTFRLTAFDLKVLNEADEVVDNVCTAAPGMVATYKVRFSLTVPTGFAAVTGVAPALSVDSVPTGATPVPLATYPSSTLSAGDVVTYTYTLPAPGIASDINLEAGATATNTSDIAGRGLLLPVGDCEGESDPSTIIAIPMRQPQVTGWTPVFAGETFTVSLQAQDDDGISSIAYMLEGANESGEEPVETLFAADPTEANLDLEMPGIGRSTLKYRVRDANGIWSTWLTKDIRTKLVVDRQTNENSPAEFRVGDPEGVGFTYSVNRVPDGITFSTETGQFAGIPSFNTKDPYSLDAEVAAGVYNVVVTEHGPGNATSDVSFVWTIDHINRHPSVTSVINGFSVNLNGPFTLDIDGLDPDGDPVIWTVNGRGVNTNQDIPNTVTINPSTGLISGTFPPGSDTEYTLSVGLSECASAGAPPCDGLVLPGVHLSTLYDINVGVLNLNHPADVVNPGPHLNAEGDSPTLQIVATDPERDTLTYEVGGLPPGLTINPNTGLISGTVDYESAGTYAVTVEVDDIVNELSRSVTFAWVITNTNRPPVVTPPDHQNNEGETVAVSIAANASDPDGDAVTFVSATGLPQGLSMNAAGAISGTLGYNTANSYPVQVVVTDGTLQGTGTFTWTILNVNRHPVLNVSSQLNAEGDTVTVQIDGTDPDGDALAFSMNGLPPGFSIDPQTGIITGTFSLTSADVYSVNVGVFDGKLAVAKTFTWTVTESNRPPVITAIPDRTDTENDVINLSVIASDPDGVPGLTYSATGLPQGVTINPATGVISGRLTWESAAFYPIAITVTDVSGAGGTATTSFNWTVNPLNRPPVVALPDRQNLEGETISVSLAGFASDPDGDTVSIVSASGFPQGLTMNASGLVTGFVAYDTAGVSTVTFVATDGAAQATTTFTWTIHDVNRLPILDVANQISAEGDTVALQIDGSDPDGDALVFSMNGLPVGFTINPSAGVITGAFDHNSAGVYTVNIGLVDVGPNATGGVAKSFTWTVTETNRPPVITPIPNKVNSENDTIVPVAVLAVDPDGDPVTFSAANLPAGLSIDPLTGVITGTLTYESAGTYAVTITATDNRNPAASSSVTFTWTVHPVNRVPTVSHPDRLNAENDTVSGYLSTASDPDGDSLTYSAVGLPPGISIGVSNGTLSGDLGYSTAGNYSPTITVSDGSLTGSHTFSWIVTNVDAPPVPTNPGPQTDYENDTISRQFSATDQDSTNLTLSASGLPPGLTMSSTGLVTGDIPYTAAGLYTVTMTVSDGTSSRSITFTWRVINVNRPPVVTHQDRSNAENDRVTGYLSTASDPDGDALTFSATGLPLGITINAANGTLSGDLDYNTAGTYTPTITVSDGSLTGSHTFAWIVTNSNRPPDAVNNMTSVTQGQSVVINVLSGDSDLDGDTLTVGAITQPAVGTGTAVLNADGTVTYNAPLTFVGPAELTYTISDGKGGTDTATVTVTVVPSNLPPVCTAAVGGEIWPPNHKRFYIAPVTGVTDPDGNPVTITVTGVFQDELLDSTGDGKFSPDARIENGTAWIRAERNGHGNKTKGNGRVYEILFTASDGRGGSCSGSVMWTVPHDQGQPAIAIDDGLRWDSTGVIPGARDKWQIHQKSY